MEDHGRRTSLTVLLGVVALGVVLILGVLVVTIRDHHREFGGMGGYTSGEPRNYDDAWIEEASGPLSERAMAAAMWTGDEVIVLGGDEDPYCADLCLDFPYPDMAAYDPATDQWRALADVPARWFDTSPTLVGDDQFLMFVYDDDTSLLRYDLGEDEWDTVAIPPDLAAGHGPHQEPVIVGPDRLVTVPSCVCPRRTPRNESLDLRTGEWTALPDDPFPATAHRQVAAVGDDLYVFARLPHTDGLRGAVLRPGARRWEDLPFLHSERRFDLGEPAVVGDLFVPNRQPPYADGEITPAAGAPAFDTRSGEWTTVSEEAADALSPDLDTLPPTAAGAATVWIGDRWFAFGGRTPSGLTNRAYTWEPPEV